MALSKRTAGDAADLMTGITTHQGLVEAMGERARLNRVRFSGGGSYKAMHYPCMIR
jgi:hypothetical protein